MANRDNESTQGGKAVEAGKTAAEETARSVRTMADDAARLSGKTARAGADAARRGAEAARDVLQTGVETANETFRRMRAGP